MSANLESVRASARSGNHKKCSDEILELFKQYECRVVLRVTISQLKAHLPIFQGFHPEILWPHEWLRQVELFQPFSKYQVLGYGIYNEDRIFDEHGISSPGSNAFINAIELLDSAFRAHLAGNQDNCLELARGAFHRVIGARTDVFWAHTDPVGYEARVRNIHREDASANQEEIETSDVAMMRFWDSPDRKEFTKQLFLTIADQIQEMINGGKNK